MRGNPGTVGMVAWVISMLMLNAPGAVNRQTDSYSSQYYSKAILYCLAREFLTCSFRISKIDVPKKFLTSSISVQINVTFEVHP